MADEGMDPCECMWSHEMAMRRLISWLRQSQAYCTDNECLNDLPLPNQAPMNGFIMMSLFIAFAFAMYMMRPGALRIQPGGDTKSNGGGGGGMPPTPPPATS